VVKFIETLFGLPALASLPDEKPYMPEGPRDANARITDLLGGFDPARLSGAATPLPAQDAIIDGVDQIPPRMNCKTLGITPITVPGSSGQPPKGYGPRAIQYIP
jgi:hypothetical protein